MSYRLEPRRALVYPRWLIVFPLLYCSNKHAAGSNSHSSNAANRFSTSGVLATACAPQKCTTLERLEVHLSVEAFLSCISAGSRQHFVRLLGPQNLVAPPLHPTERPSNNNS